MLRERIARIDAAELGAIGAVEWRYLGLGLEPKRVARIARLLLLVETEDVTRIVSLRERRAAQDERTDDKPPHAATVARAFCNQA